MLGILFCVFGVAVALIVCWFLAVREQTDFKKRFPPISDAEFLARCTPGTNPEIALKVRRLVSDAFNVRYERVYPTSRFIEDLGG